MNVQHAEHRCLNMSHKPRDFQEEFIALAKDRNAMNNDEPGLGKTLQAIEALAHMRYEDENVHQMQILLPNLVVCPKSTRVQWYNEIKFQDPEMPVVILDTDGKFKDQDLRVSGHQVTVTWRGWIITHIQNIRKWAKELEEIHFLGIVVDEAHIIKNRQAKQTIYLKRLKAERKIALTATPIEKRPTDYWSIINWLYPEEFTSFHRFQHHFENISKEITYGGRSYPKYNGPKNTEQLMREIGPFTKRRTKQDVMPELPPRIYQTVEVTMEGQQAGLYHEIATAKDIEVDLSAFRETEEAKTDQDFLVIKNVLSKIVKLQQVSSNPREIGYDISSAKLEWLDDYLSDVPHQVVIFTKFRATAQRIASLWKAPCLIGGVKNAVVAMSPFLRGDSQFIVGTIAYMGVAIDGLQKASEAIFLDQEWSTIKMSQAVDRVHRMNIDEPKIIRYLESRNSVDQLVLEALNKKWTDREIIERFLERWST